MLAVRARQLLVLLAALMAVALAAGAGLAVAPAAHASGAQNRVRASTPAAQLLARATTSRSACSRPGFTVSAVGLASGFCVATEDATTLYRVQPLSKASSELNDGLDPADFDEGDQSAHFGNEERTEDFYNNHSDTHGNGYQVEVPNSWLRDNNIETWEGTGDELEYVIPRDLFGEFNQFPRGSWAPGGS
jgi:hypothetical protein